MVREIIFLTVCVVMLSACSSVVVDSENVRRNSRMNLFTPIPGKTVVYVYRDASLLEGYYTSEFIINGHSVSTGARNSFNILVLPPGNYVIGVTSSFQKGEYLPTDITFREGEIHYLHVYWENDAEFRVKAVIDTKAKKVISAARLIAYKELCTDYSINDDQKKKLGDSQVFFRPYRKGICSAPSPK